MKLYACRCGCSTPVLMYRRPGGPEGKVLSSADFYLRLQTEHGVRWRRPAFGSQQRPICPACQRPVSPRPDTTTEVQPEGMPPAEFAALALALYAKGERSAVRVHRLSSALQAWERANG